MSGWPEAARGVLGATRPEPPRLELIAGLPSMLLEGQAGSTEIILVSRRQSDRLVMIIFLKRIFVS